MITRTVRGSAIFSRVQAEEVSDHLVERWIADPQQFRAELVRIVSAGPLARQEPLGLSTILMPTQTRNATNKNIGHRPSGPANV